MLMRRREDALKLLGCMIVRRRGSRVMGMSNN